LMGVREGYANASIPLDTIWSDIDYMDNYNDFSYDPVAFKGLPEFIKDLHDNHGMKYIPIIDAAVALNDSNAAYKEGQAAGAFIKATKELSDSF